MIDKKEYIINKQQLIIKIIKNLVIDIYIRRYIIFNIYKQYNKLKKVILYKVFIDNKKDY